MIRFDADLCRPLRCDHEAIQSHQNSAELAHECAWLREDEACAPLKRPVSCDSGHSAQPERAVTWSLRAPSAPIFGGCGHDVACPSTQSLPPPTFRWLFGRHWKTTIYTAGRPVCSLARTCPNMRG